MRGPGKAARQGIQNPVVDPTGNPAKPRERPHNQRIDHRRKTQPGSHPFRRSTGSKRWPLARKARSGRQADRQKSKRGCLARRRRYRQFHGKKSGCGGMKSGNPENAHGEHEGGQNRDGRRLRGVWLSAARGPVAKAEDQQLPARGIGPGECTRDHDRDAGPRAGMAGRSRDEFLAPAAA